MSVDERFSIRTVTAAGSYDFVNNKANPDRTSGFRVQAICDGNFELSVLATDLDTSVTSNWTDITSTMTDIPGTPGGTIKTNGFFESKTQFGAVRVNVTSVQAAKTLLLSASWV